jgi:nitroreductase
MGICEATISRRSIKRFKDIPITHGIPGRCINAVKLVSSSSKLQTLECIIVDDAQLLLQVFFILKWAAYISPAGNPPHGKSPKAYIIIPKNRDIGVSSSVYDVKVALENITLIALEESIGSCPVASVDRNELKKTLDIPSDYELSLVLALGYPDENPTVESFEGSVKY